MGCWPVWGPIRCSGGGAISDDRAEHHGRVNNSKRKPPLLDLSGPWPPFEISNSGRPSEHGSLGSSNVSRAFSLGREGALG